MIVGIVQGFVEVIDFRNSFSTERFIVPITDHFSIKHVVVMLQ